MDDIYKATAIGNGIEIYADDASAAAKEFVKVVENKDSNNKEI